MTNTVRAWSLDASARGPSTRLWGRKAQPLTGQLWQDPNCGYGYFDEFLDFYASGNRYTLTEGDTGASIGIRSEVGGVIRLTTGGTANNEATVMGGVNEGAPFVITGGGGELWFEARVRPGNVTNSVASWAIGLCEEGGAGANFLTDATGVMSDIDFVGFNVVDADADALTTIHNTASGGGITTVSTSLDNGALTASTWVKVGFYFDGTTITFYVDGEPDSTTVDYDATNFPDGEELHVCFGTKTTAGTSINLDVDWIAVAQAV